MCITRNIPRKAPIEGISVLPSSCFTSDNQTSSFVIKANKSSISDSHVVDFISPDCQQRNGNFENKGVFERNEGKKRYTSRPGLTAKNKVRHFVQHNYHDLSNEMPDSTFLSQLHTNSALIMNHETFPYKLYEMLDFIEYDVNGGGKYKDIIGWQPHGRAFLIRKPNTFVAEVLPKFFKQTKLTSFQRQLNLYGFERLTHGIDAGAYYNELFLRDRKFLLDRIMRKKVKGTGYKAAGNPDNEPNFYELPYVVPFQRMEEASERHSKDELLAASSPLRSNKIIIKNESNNNDFRFMKPNSEPTRQEELIKPCHLHQTEVVTDQDWHIVADALFNEPHFCSHHHHHHDYDPHYKHVTDVESSNDSSSSSCSSDHDFDDCDLMLLNMPVNNDVFGAFEAV